MRKAGLGVCQIQDDENLYFFGYKEHHHIIFHAGVSIHTISTWSWHCQDTAKEATEGAETAEAADAVPEVGHHIPWKGGFDHRTKHESIGKLISLSSEDIWIRKWAMGQFRNIIRIIRHHKTSWEKYGKGPRRWPEQNVPRRWRATCWRDVVFSYWISMRNPKSPSPKPKCWCRKSGSCQHIWVTFSNVFQCFDYQMLLFFFLPIFSFPQVIFALKKFFSGRCNTDPEHWRRGGVIWSWFVFSFCFLEEQGSLVWPRPRWPLTWKVFQTVTLWDEDLGILRPWCQTWESEVASEVLIIQKLQSSSSWNNLIIQAWWFLGEFWSSKATIHGPRKVAQTTSSFPGWSQRHRLWSGAHPIFTVTKHRLVTAFLQAVSC